MPETQAPTTPVSTSFVYSGTELDAMAEARNYCRWIFQFFQPYLGARIVEIGAGTGTFSRLLLEAHTAPELTLFEAAANLFPALERQFAADPRVRLHFGSFNPSLLGKSPDSVVMVNVLEHISDDDGVLSEIHQSLSSGGHLLLFVPALEWNFGSLDKAFDHFRRYSKPALRTKIERAGFQLVRLRYVNALGIASWFLAGKILRQRTLNPAQVRWYDRWIIPWSFRLEGILKPPLGQSLLAVARK